MSKHDPKHDPTRPKPVKPIQPIEPVPQEDPEDYGEWDFDDDDLDGQDGEQDDEQEPEFIDAADSDDGDDLKDTDDDDERALAFDPRGDTPPPLPQNAAPTKLSNWLDLGDVRDDAGKMKYPQFKGWYIKVRLDVSLGFMAAAEALQDAAREARKQSMAQGKRVRPAVRSDQLRAILSDLVVMWNFVDEFGRPLEQPPLGLLALRGDLMTATFERSMSALAPSKPRSRHLRRR